MQIFTRKKFCRLTCIRKLCRQLLENNNCSFIYVNKKTNVLKFSNIIFHQCKLKISTTFSKTFDGYLFLKSSIHKSSRQKVFYKKYVLWNFSKFTTKLLCYSFFFNKVARCFPVNLQHFTLHLFTEHIRVTVKPLLHLSV